MKPVITDETTAIEYGCECVCTNHAHGAEHAPVFLLVIRDGKELRVCTRCDLWTDQKVARLVTLLMPGGPFFEFDSLGAFRMPKVFDEYKVEADYRQSLATATVQTGE